MYANTSMQFASVLQPSCQSLKVQYNSYPNYYPIHKIIPIKIILNDDEEVGLAGISENITESTDEVSISRTLMSYKNVYQMQERNGIGKDIV
jgi:hypothetical protein